MKWQKLGLVFCPDKQFPWMASHASNPTAELLGGGLVRVYFSTRDAQNRSNIASLVFDVNRPNTIVDLSSTPLVAPGARGLFDDSGAGIGCLAKLLDKIYLYYLGWNLGITVPWRISIGLAVSHDGGRSFEKYSEAPLLDRSAVDPYSLSYPWVLHNDNGWRMWYGSNLRWGAMPLDMSYVIKYAESPDGLTWHRANRVAIAHGHPGEYALSRSCVIRDPKLYRMWFSHRGTAYRIGYAESGDGLHWQRDDERAGIDVSVSGWDSEMIEYPCVFDCCGNRYMLYNVNGYGLTGFGLARADRA